MHEDINKQEEPWVVLMLLMQSLHLWIVIACKLIGHKSVRGIRLKYVLPERAKSSEDYQRSWCQLLIGYQLPGLQASLSRVWTEKEWEGGWWTLSDAGKDMHPSFACLHMADLKKENLNNCPSSCESPQRQQTSAWPTKVSHTVHFFIWFLFGSCSVHSECTNSQGAFLPQEGVLEPF